MPSPFRDTAGSAGLNCRIPSPPGVRCGCRKVRYAHIGAKEKRERRGEAETAERGKMGEVADRNEDRAKETESVEKEKGAGACGLASITISSLPYQRRTGALSPTWPFPGNLKRFLSMGADADLCTLWSEGWMDGYPEAGMVGRG